MLAGFSLLWLDLNFPVAGFETRLVSAGRRFDHVINKDEVFGTHSSEFRPISLTHLTGIIRCSYGVSGHMTYGFDVSGLAPRG